MALEFRCPGCRKEFVGSDELAGKRVRCRQCGMPMIVPSTSSSTAGSPPETSSALVTEDIYSLEDLPSVPPGGVSSPKESPGRTKTRAGTQPSRSTSTTLSAQTWWKGLGAATVIVLLAALFLIRNNPKDQGPAPAVPRLPSPKLVAIPPEEPSVFPGRGQGREIVPGVTFHSVRVGSSSTQPGATLGQGMTLWLYLPEGKHEPGTLPCVLIAPAGTILLTGIGLADGDRPEHIPFARAGFAVLAYELDGPISDEEMTRPSSLKRACESFLAARCGLTNAKVALDWLNRQVPEVDKSRIFTAGHSSAGTMALLLVENEPRIRACAAFNAPADTGKNFDEGIKGQFRTIVPQLDEFFTTYNPIRHAEQIKVPLFLFNSLEDTVVSADSTRSFAETLKGLKKQVVVEIVPTGDHHASMIEEGIPLAIKWFMQFKSS